MVMITAKKASENALNLSSPDCLSAIHYPRFANHATQQHMPNNILLTTSSANRFHWSAFPSERSGCPAFFTRHFSMAK